jgi:AraC family transcriptional regulator
MSDILYGPRFDRLGSDSVVLNARARRHQARAVCGPLSIKHVLQGEASWQVGGQRFTVDADSALVLGRGEVYDLDLQAATPVETFVVFFAHALEADACSTRLGRLAQLLDDPQRRRHECCAVTRRLWPSLRFHQALQQLRAQGAAAEHGEAELRLRCLLDLLLDLASEVRSERERIAAARPATRAEVHRRVLLGKAWLDEHYAASFDLAAAASAACLAPHHFHRSFKAVLRCSPFAYVGRRRLLKARRLLLLGNASVTEVCLAVGYASLPSFTRQFGRAFGLSPGQLRKSGKPG